MKKSWIVSFSLVALVLVSGVTAWLYVQVQLKMTPILVAKTELSARHRIEADDVEWLSVPTQFIRDDMILSLEEVEGRYVVMDGFIPKGSMIYRSVVEVLDETIDRPSLLLKENQALYTLDASLISSAGNTLVVHQKVDLYGTVKLNKQVIVDPLLTQVRIVGLKDKNGEDLKDKDRALPKVILLAVDKEAISLLAKLDALGTITLTPTQQASEQAESQIIMDTALWNLLYVQ